MAEKAREKRLEAAGGKTLRTWGKEFLDRREKRGVRDIAGERSAWRLHIESAAFIDRPLRSIKPRHVIAWIDALQAKAPTSPNGQPLKTQTISRKRAKDVLGLLRLALKEAVQAGFILTNPARELAVRREQRTEDTWTSLDLDEQGRLFQAIPEPERWVVMFALGTGLRSGELAGLELRDVHVDGKTPRVVVRHGKAPGHGNRATKSGRTREVPLFGLGLRAARAWLAVLPAFTRANPLALMFPTERGEARQGARFFKRQWPAWIRAAGLRPAQRRDGLPVRWYDATRHTFATSLLSGLWGSAWRIEDVSAALGHRDITTTQRHYARVLPSALQERAEAAEADFAVALGETPAPEAKVAGRLPRDTGSETGINEGRAITRDAAFYSWFRDPGPDRG